MGFKDLSNKVTYTDNGGSFDNQAVDTVNVENSLSVLANNALSSANAANTSKEAAETAKTAAETAKTNAETAETNAETAETNAETAETNAASSATASANSATAGANSATAAATSETNASNSAATATTKANLATTQATNAANSATASATSANNAATSATAAQTARTNAETAETNAETAETNAETAETNAAASAVTAATQATNSSNSATAAATSATAAQTAQTAAETAETNAETAETNAETAETNAAASASTASTHASTATTKASEAATSATNAASSATNAANSATGASNSQIAAASSAASAAAIFDQFDDTYLGSKSSAPTVDNDGNALVTGALYYNSSTQGMFIWTGSEWVAASAAGGASLNNFSYTATAGQTTFSGSDENSNTMSYTVDNIIVTLNGVVLEGGGTDYTATNGSSVVLTSGAVVSDEVNIVAFKTFTTADMVSASNGGAYQGNVDFAAGIDVTGNITVTGTVDGRDLAADGTKLDALEANANVTDTANVTAAGALMDSEVTNLAQVKAFDSSDYATAAQGTTANNALPRAGGTMTGNLSFGDNDKAIFGAGSDLQIYHDGTNSYIKDAGTGDLLIQATDQIKFKKADGSEYHAIFADGGSVDLYYAGVEKFKTTSTGIDVTGTVTSDGLTVDSGSNGTIDFGDVTTAYGRLYADNTGTFVGSKTNQPLILRTNNTERFRIDSSGHLMGKVPDVKIGADTGAVVFGTVSANSTKFITNDTERMRIDSSGRVGIGTSSPSSELHVKASSGFAEVYVQGSNSSSGMYLFDQGTEAGLWKVDSGHLAFGTTNSERMRINSSGSVGIGKTPPTDTHATWSQLFLGEKGSYISEKSSSGGIFGNFVTDNIYIDADTGSFANITTDESSAYRQEGGVHHWYSQASGSAGAAVTLSEKMRIDSSGNVGIGDSVPQDYLEINGSGRGLGGLTISNSSASHAALSFARSSTATARIKIHEPAALHTSSMKFETSNASGGSPNLITAMTIDENQNVGIGTSSPQTELHVHDPAGLAKIRLSGTASSSDTFEIAQGTTGVTNGGFTIRDVEASSDRLVINSSGNVGIGTSSPSKRLHVYNTASADAAMIESTQSFSTLAFKSSTNSSTATFGIDGAGNVSMENKLSSGNATFVTNGSERMRIDSSGNVLVGKTSSNAATAGHEFLNYGRSIHTVNASTVQIINRLSNDGDITIFQKDGTTVGAIGVLNSNNLTISGTVADHGGLQFGTHCVIPMEANVDSDGTVDLGSSNSKFKDGHFSGSLYGDGSNLTGVGGSTTAGAVGTYTVAANNTTNSATIATGATVAGSTLLTNYFSSGHRRPLMGEYSNSASFSQSGTWRNMTGATTGSQYNVYATSLWVRIS